MGADSEMLTPEAPERLTVAEAGGVGPGEGGAKRPYRVRLPSDRLGSVHRPR